MSELNKRILTAIVLIPSVLLLVFGLGDLGFTAAMTLVLILAVWEWCRLTGVSQLSNQIVHYILIVGLALICLLIDSLWVYGLAGLWWCTAFYLVLTYPKTEGLWKQSASVKTVMGALILVPTWLGMIELQADSPWKMLFVFMLVWTADIGAYFFGKAFGKHKLAPNVSPGKSIEGFLGGFLLAIAMGVVLKSYVGLGSLGLMEAVFIFGAVIAFSVVGDLTESLFKRSQNLKDSSQLLPGHGGILDRIDSLCAAVPIFFVMINLIA